MSWIKPAFGQHGSSGVSPAKTSKISNISKSETENTLQDENVASIWLEKYKPKCTKDLVVDVKKIKELERWLKKSENLNSTTKFLLLTGPPGSGKTTTLHTVCEHLGFRMIEWITPLDRLENVLDNSPIFEYRMSVAQLFREHLFRATRYNSCLVSNPSRHVLLVKDFPNVLIQRPSVLHDIIETLLRSVTLFPVVFICNNEHDYNELFPHSIKDRFSIHTITFNPVTEKRVYTVLKNIIISHKTKSHLKEEHFPDNILSHISCSCNGDLRSAIGRLYLSSVGISTRFKKKDNGLHLETVESALKDKRLDFFHGLGRVLYPKRIESDGSLKFVHSVEAIVENFVSEPGRFLSQLHENYPSRMVDMEGLSKAAGRLATSDVLRSRWQDRDVFNHYSLAVAVRGLMVHNRRPQKARFEAFRKSHTSRMEVDNKAIELEGKTLFFDMKCTNRDYLIDVLPFANLLMSNINHKQLEYVHKTCCFSENMSYK